MENTHFIFLKVVKIYRPFRIFVILGRFFQVSSYFKEGEVVDNYSHKIFQFTPWHPHEGSKCPNFWNFLTLLILLDGTIIFLNTSQILNYRICTLISFMVVSSHAKLTRIKVVNPHMWCMHVKKPPESKFGPSFAAHNLNFDSGAILKRGENSV